MSNPTLVMLVDDHEDSVAMYALMLGAIGFRVATAATAEQAYELAQQLRPDAVVADVRLQGSSGLDLARRLRTHERTSHMAILMLTGDACARQSAEDVGSDRFLLKPVTPAELVAAIVGAVAERQQVAGDMNRQAGSSIH
jgi:two-component system phosphate regulon response regulator PhoB